MKTASLVQILMDLMVPTIIRTLKIHIGATDYQLNLDIGPK